MISNKYKNLVIAIDGRSWIPVPADNPADDYRLGQMVHQVLPAGEVFCRLGMWRDVPELKPVVLLPLPGCPHDNISLPTTSDPTSVCADCGAEVPASLLVSVFVDLLGHLGVRLGYFDHAIEDSQCVRNGAAWRKYGEWKVFNPKLSFLEVRLP